MAILCVFLFLRLRRGNMCVVEALFQLSALASAPHTHPGNRQRRNDTVCCVCVKLLKKIYTVYYVLLHYYYFVFIMVCYNINTIGHYCNLNFIFFSHHLHIFCFFCVCIVTRCLCHFVVGFGCICFESQRTSIALPSLMNRHG